MVSLQRGSWNEEDMQSRTIATLQSPLTVTQERNEPLRNDSSETSLGSRHLWGENEEEWEAVMGDSRFISLQPGRWLYLSLIGEPWRRRFVGNGDEPSFEHAEFRSPVDSNIN